MLVVCSLAHWCAAAMWILIWDIPVDIHCLILAGVSHIIWSLVTPSINCWVAGSRLVVWSNCSTCWHSCIIVSSDGVGG